MKLYITLSILLFFRIGLSGQHDASKDILIADTTWGKEVINMPFHFAPEIQLEGYEDIRFAPGWGTIGSVDFWTYTFVWKTNMTTAPTAAFLEKNLVHYFHGLMEGVNKEPERVLPQTITNIQESKNNNGQTIFTGQVTTHDSFRTRDTMTLNVHIEIHYCDQNKSYLPFFRFSPQPFDHEIWKKLAAINLIDHICLK